MEIHRETHWIDLTKFSFWFVVRFVHNRINSIFFCLCRYFEKVDEVDFTLTVSIFAAKGRDIDRQTRKALEFR